MSLGNHRVSQDGEARSTPFSQVSRFVLESIYSTSGSLPPGTYSYHCEIHPFMRGRIQVKRVVRNDGVTEL